MRVKDVPVLLGSGKCGVEPCISTWAKWCRGCNLVFCGVHAPRGAHKCESRDAKKWESIVEEPVETVEVEDAG